MVLASGSAQHPVHNLVRDRYAASARSAIQGTTSCCGGPSAVEIEPGFGAQLYSPADRADLPSEVVAASLGCGNPTAVADLRPGERVLDLGSGGGLDVLLSARRVGPTGFAYGLDMTEEMLDLAQTNARQAGVSNVEFLHGQIEHVPLPEGAVDVVISNCVVNLSPDKGAVLAEAFRVLAPGGRLRISDVVADNSLTPDERAARGSWVGCIAGALSIGELEALLAHAGFAGVAVTPTHEVAPGTYSATIRASKPGSAAPRPVVRVFEPALCVSSGLCVPDVDEALRAFSADLAQVQEQGADIARHSLAGEPRVFAEDPTVRGFLQRNGSEGLPLTTVDGSEVLAGRYPSRTELLKLAGLGEVPAASIVPDGASLLAPTGTAGCCGGTGCC